MEHKSEGDTNCNWCAEYSHQRIGTGTGGLANKRTTGDHLNYSIIEICQNTKKSPGDLIRLAVTQDFSEKPSANAGVENSQMSKIIIKITQVTDLSIMMGWRSFESQYGDPIVILRMLAFLKYTDNDHCYNTLECQSNDSLRG